MVVPPANCDRFFKKVLDLQVCRGVLECAILANVFHLKRKTVP